MKLTQYILVFIQFAGIFLMIFSGESYNPGILSGTLLLSSVFLAVWAYKSMYISTFSILPAVRENAQLCTRGPYRLIRHPMYSAVLLFMTGLLESNFSYFRLFILIIVFVDLLIKISVEEKFLIRKFDRYSGYKKGTKKLIPFVI